MTIGQLAERAGVNIETVRYYERRGLLPEPARTGSGYRFYESGTLARLRFIKRAQGLGFTLHEIEDLLALRVRDRETCEAVGHKTREKIVLVRRKIRELEAMQQSLARLAAMCEAGRPTAECPILHALEGGDDA
ncbi:MAG: MerR family transcriptional regulator [Gemmatimonadaceae bacterium]